jgi:DNA polymerase III subunit gamma/tau
VRYLRNALMAKLDGEQTELLQISTDERARAARTALLFTEEDLTRNLQIVLRTFDDLNYRQEQRFHLELGLLKLIHAQRLLPLEELLSGVSGGTGMRGGTASLSPTPRPPASAPRQTTLSVPSVPTAAPTPTLSPFGNANTWGSQASIKQTAAAAEPLVEVTSSAPPREVTRFPVASSSSPVPGFVEQLTEGSLAKAPQNGGLQTSTAPPPSTDAVRNAICATLTEGGFESAALLLGAGEWTIDGASVRIEVASMGKKMLSLTVNAAAEKIIRQELQRLGASSRFLIVPGAANGTAPSGMPAPLAGSVQDEALKNPLVQRAKEIFNAEVRSVVDLRVK